jgi:hypothetical protein
LVVDNLYESAVTYLNDLAVAFAPIAIARVALSPQMQAPRRPRRIGLAVEHLILAVEGKLGARQASRVAVGIVPDAFLGLGEAKRVSIRGEEKKTREKGGEEPIPRTSPDALSDIVHEVSPGVGQSTSMPLLWA